MKFDKQSWINEVLTNPRRKTVPVMTSPGAELIGAKPREVFQNGELQFRCIEALGKAAPVDMQVTFMDLSIEAEAFGSEIAFSDYENPTVAKPLVCNLPEIEALAIPHPGAKRTAEILKCATLCAQKLDRFTLGGMIGPYSLAGRLFDMTEMMILAATEPDTAHALLAKTAAFLRSYAQALKSTGVAGILIAEPAAGLLSPEMCQEFAADYIKTIVDAVKDDSFMVILHNCGKTEKQVGALLSTGADALHVGNAVDIADILRQVPATTPVMGNLDPVSVFKTLPPEDVYQKTLALLERTKTFPNYVLSSGCDLPPAVPIANVRAFLQARQDYNHRLGNP